VIRIHYTCVPRVALSGFAAHNATLTRSVIKIAMFSDRDEVLRCRRKLTIRVTRSGIASKVCTYILTAAFSSTNNGCSILSDAFFSVIAFVITVIFVVFHTADADERMRCELTVRRASTMITVYQLVIEFLEIEDAEWGIRLNGRTQRYSQLKA